MRVIWTRESHRRNLFQSNVFQTENDDPSVGGYCFVLFEDAIESGKNIGVDKYFL